MISFCPPCFVACPAAIRVPSFHETRLFVPDLLVVLRSVFEKPGVIMSTDMFGHDGSRVIVIWRA
jgi:hypothetical protein